MLIEPRPRSPHSSVLPFHPFNPFNLKPADDRRRVTLTLTRIPVLVITSLLIGLFLSCHALIDVVNKDRQLVLMAERLVLVSKSLTSEATSEKPTSPLHHLVLHGPPLRNR